MITDYLIVGAFLYFIYCLFCVFLVITSLREKMGETKQVHVFDILRLMPDSYFNVLFAYSI